MTINNHEVINFGEYMLYNQVECFTDKSNAQKIRAVVVLQSEPGLHFMIRVLTEKSLQKKNKFYIITEKFRP